MWQQTLILDDIQLSGSSAEGLPPWDLYRKALHAGFLFLSAGQHRFLYVIIIAACAALATMLLRNAGVRKVDAFLGGVIVGISAEGWLSPAFINGSYNWIAVLFIHIFFTAIWSLAKNTGWPFFELDPPAPGANSLTIAAGVSGIVSALALILTPGPAKVGFILVLPWLWIVVRRGMGLTARSSIVFSLMFAIVAIVLVVVNLQTHPYSAMPGRINFQPVNIILRGVDLIGQSLTPWLESRFSTGHTWQPSLGDSSVILGAIFIVIITYVVVRKINSRIFRLEELIGVSLILIGAATALALGINTRLHLWYGIVPAATLLPGALLLLWNSAKGHRHAVTWGLILISLVHIGFRSDRAEVVRDTFAKVEFFEDSLLEVYEQFPDAPLIRIVVPYQPVNSGIVGFRANSLAENTLNREGDRLLPKFIVGRCEHEFEALQTSSVSPSKDVTVKISETFESWQVLDSPCSD